MEQVGRIPSLVRTSMSALENLTSSLAENSSYASESATSRSHLSKLKLWSGCLGAHRITGTRSLSYRLRDASSIRKTVIFLLENLERHVEEARTIAQQISAKHNNEEYAVDSTDEELAEYFCGSDSDGSSDKDDLKRVLSQIEEVLDCLLRLAVTVRNPAPYDQFRSRAGIISVPYQWDIEHIQHKFPRTHPTISDRLGKALTQRRQYLTYREEHHLRLQEGLDDGDEVDNASENKGTTIASYLPHDPRSDAPVAMEETEDIFSEMSTISYATTSADEGVSRIPPIPSEYKNGPFLCLFCQMLISIDVENKWRARLEWKKHVYPDLRPYVCLEVECSLASQDFEKRRDWIRHMIQEHWRNWTCPFECTLRFQTFNEARKHTLDKHKAQISTERVEMLVSLSSNADLTCAEGTCPLCLKFDITNSGMYESHVGKHLEQLALFVLPQNGDDESEQDNEAQDDQDENWETAPEEEQISDTGVEIGSEEGEEEPERLRPHGSTHHAPPAPLFARPEVETYKDTFKPIAYRMPPSHPVDHYSNAGFSMAHASAPDQNPAVATPAAPAIDQSHATVSDGFETVEDSSDSSFSKDGHSSVSGVNVPRHNKPLPPIIMEDSKDTVANKRARNKIAARKPRERKATKMRKLKEKIGKLEDDGEM